MAEAFRKDVISAQVKLEQVEEEVGLLEKGIGKMMDHLRSLMARPACAKPL